MTPSERPGPVAHPQPVGHAALQQRHGAAQLLVRLVVTATLATAGWLLFALFGTAASAHPQCSDCPAAPTTSQDASGTEAADPDLLGSLRDAGGRTLGGALGVVDGAVSTVGDTVGAVHDTVGGVVGGPVAGLPPVGEIVPIGPPDPAPLPAPSEPSTPDPADPPAEVGTQPPPDVPAHPAPATPPAGKPRDSRDAVPAQATAPTVTRTDTTAVSPDPVPYRVSGEPVAPPHPTPGTPGGPASSLVHSGHDNGGGHRGLLTVLPIASVLGGLALRGTTYSMGHGSTSRDPGLPATSPD